MRQKLFAGFFAVFLPSFEAGGAEKLTLVRLREIVYRTEADFNIPENLLDSIIWQESSYRIYAFNSSRNKNVAISSYGLGQLTLDTARFHCRLKRRRIYDPHENIRCSAKVLKYQLKRYRNMEAAVAAYNWGTPCRCNGTYFEKRKGYGAGTLVPCRRFNKRKRVFVKIACGGKGLYFNQAYVDDVMERRQRNIRKRWEMFNAPTLAVVEKDNRTPTPQATEEKDRTGLPAALFPLIALGEINYVEKRTESELDDYFQFAFFDQLFEI